MDIHKILVPVDDSSITQEAIMQALKIAKKSKGTKITLVHVVDHPSPISSRSIVARVEESNQRWIKYGEELLCKYYSWLSKKYNRLDTVLLSGSVPDAIARYAEKTEQDLIIMGRRKLSILQRLFLSHVSDKVAATTNIPVLKVHESSNLITFPLSCKTS